MQSSTSSREKAKPSVAKFEEFFSSKYKDTVFEALEKYPDERSVNRQSITLNSRCSFRPCRF